MALPSGKTSRIRSIVTYDGELAQAFPPMSIAIQLEDELDISRGDVLAAGAIQLGHRFEAHVVWMDERPLNPERPYLIKHNARIVTAEVNGALALNGIGQLTVTASRPLLFDPYHQNRHTGSFVIIDPATNFTAGAGMIVRGLRDHTAGTARPTAAERIAQAAREAASHADAVEAVRRVLEEVLV